MQAVDHLIEDGPDVFLLHVLHRLLVLVNLCLQIATIGELHHNTQRGTALFKEGLFVCRHIFMLNRGQNAHFVDCIVLLFGRELGKSNFLKCILLAIRLALNFVYL